jgi:peptidoglycan/LPS O-acetylase OafA/YrhL
VVLVAAITLPIAALSWFRVEKPLMQRAGEWARRRRPAPRPEHEAATA